jgi:Domain of unknown function (DUF4328)
MSSRVDPAVVTTTAPLGQPTVTNISATAIPGWPSPLATGATITRGQMAPGGEGSWFSPGYRPTRTRARLAQVLVGIAAATNAAAAITLVYELSLLDRVAGGSATDSEVAGFVSFLDSLSSLLTIVMVASAIAVLAWLSRTVEIIPQLGGGMPRRSPREAIGWWFVPIASFVIPYQIVRDAWRRLETPTRRGRDGILLTWWLLFVVGGLVSRVVAIALDSASTVDTYRGVVVVEGAATFATAMSGLLLVWIVGQVESRANERAASVLVHGPLAGAPGSVPPSWSASISATTPSRIVGPADPSQLGRYRVLEVVGSMFVPGQVVDLGRHGPSIVLSIAGRSYWMVPAGETTTYSSGNMVSLSRGSESVTLERVDGPPTDLVLRALRVENLSSTGPNVIDEALGRQN